MKVRSMEKEIEDNQNHKHGLKNQIKKMKEDSTSQVKFMLGKCRALRGELRRRGTEEDEENLVDTSRTDVAVVEEEERILALTTL